MKNDESRAEYEKVDRSELIDLFYLIRAVRDGDKSLIALMGAKSWIQSILDNTREGKL